MVRQAVETNRFGPAQALAITGGEIMVTGGYHRVDTEAGSASDDLHTINGSRQGDTVTLQTVSDARTVVLKSGQGNLTLPSDIVMNTTSLLVQLQFHDGRWSAV